MEDAMDRLEAMSILVAAVESGSLTAASRKLGAPLPTVSRKVAELEAHLGTRLLIRSTRRLTLTEAGLAYVTASKRILQQVEEVERAASGEYSTPRGDLIVTAPVVCGRLHVLPVVTDFLAAYPDISVRLSLSDRNAHLVDDHIDLAVRIGTLPDSSMVATRVGWASPAYFAAHGVPKHPADLADLACISFDVLNSPTAWNFATPGAKGEQTVAVRSRLSVNTAEAAIDAAVAGAGVTRVLSYQVARALAEDRLRIVLAPFEFPPVPVSLVHAPGLTPLKLRAFLDFAAPRLRKALDPIGGVLAVAPEAMACRGTRSPTSAGHQSR
jgi:DNA-binding transcriptional LysR family regulator